MKNRAKCRLCQSIIESFHATDYVECKCGEIAVLGGNAMRCEANDFHNFLRVDDLGNEIVVKVLDPSGETYSIVEHKKINKEDLLRDIDSIIKSIDNLPPEALCEPISHYDYYSLLLIVASSLRAS